MSLLSEVFHDQLKTVRNIFEKHAISQTPNFKKWKKDFIKLYNEKSVNLDLYTSYSILYFLSYYLIKIFLDKKHPKSVCILKKPTFIEIRSNIIDDFESFNLKKIAYFDPILNCLTEKQFLFFSSLILKIFKKIQDKEIENIYYLDYAMQNFLSPKLRHKMGEFYTPPFLTKKMAEYSYNFGDYVLDPCCGSGNFLLAIIDTILKRNEPIENKIEAIDKIYGFDINPMAILMAKINIALLLGKKNSKIYSNLYNFDCLEPDNKIKGILFDLVIGNPPWYTLRDIVSVQIQNYIKNLAEELHIKPQPKNILNIEIATIFFYQCKNLYLKNNGKIFFVLSEGIINGSHASRFRNFNNLKEIIIWSFSKQIQNLFNVKAVCLFAINSDKKNNKPKKIPCLIFDLKNNKEDLKNFDEIQLEVNKKLNFIPYDKIQKANKVYTKKLISEEEYNLLGNLEESPYKKLFHKGADLNPRNLIFVEITEKNQQHVNIKPDEKIFKRAKVPWNHYEFDNEVVEKEYIFNVIKSTELVKFLVFGFYNVFLPISQDTLKFHYNKLPPNARNFYDKINKRYLNLKKKTTKNKSLIENLDRWSKLCNKRQMAKIKVVYNNSGSILKSAVVLGDFIITGDLSFYDSKTIEEAYYLSAVLNSPILTEKISIMKSSRHIFKIPFNIPIKKFDKKNKNHQKLVKYGKNGEELTRNVYQNFRETEQEDFSKRKLEKKIKRELDSLFNKINITLEEDLEN